MAVLIPNFTVVTNIVSLESKDWVGMSWEFFNDETDAWECYERHIVLGNVPTKRPFHRNDIQHMGAAHRDDVAKAMAPHADAKTA